MGEPGLEQAETMQIGIGRMIEAPVDRLDAVTPYQAEKATKGPRPKLVQTQGLGFDPRAREGAARLADRGRLEEGQEQAPLLPKRAGEQQDLFFE